MSDRTDTRAQLRRLAERYLEQCDEYTNHEERERLVSNWEAQYERAQSIVSDFKLRAGDPSGSRFLEVGFGSGIQLLTFAKAGAQVSGLEVNPVLYEIATECFAREGVEGELHLYDGSTMPFNDSTFDFAFSVSVLEHTADPDRLISEVARVLVPGGKFYLSFPNRLTLREHHTDILGISYLPRAWASYIVRKFYNRNSVEELNLHFVSYLTLLRSLRGTGLRIQYEVGDAPGMKAFVKRVLSWMGIHHGAFLRTIMIVLVKSEK